MLYYNNRVVKRIDFNDLTNNKLYSPRILQQINGAGKTVGLWAVEVFFSNYFYFPTGVKKVALYRKFCGNPGSPTGKIGEVALSDIRAGSAAQIVPNNYSIFWGDELYIQIQADDGYHINKDDLPDWVIVENDFTKTSLNHNQTPKGVFKVNTTSVIFRNEILGTNISAYIIPFEATLYFTEGVLRVEVERNRNGNILNQTVNTDGGKIINLKYGDVVTFHAINKSNWVIYENTVVWTVGKNIVTPFGTTNAKYVFSSGANSGIEITFGSVYYTSLSSRTLKLYAISNFGTGSTTLSGTLHLTFQVRNLNSGTTTTKTFDIQTGTDNAQSWALSSSDFVLSGHGEAQTSTQYSPRIEFKITYGSTTQPYTQIFDASGADTTSNVLKALNWPAASSGGGGGGGGGGGCVQKDTAILVREDGYTLAAKDLQKDDIIMGWVDGQLKPVKILQKYHAKDLSKFIRITLDNDTLIEITPNHPVLCEKEYKAIKNKDYPLLTQEDKIQTVDGLCNIVSIEEVILDKQIVVNFLTESDNFIAAGTIVASESPNVQGVLEVDPFSRTDNIINHSFTKQITSIMTTVTPGAIDPGISHIPEDPGWGDIIETPGLDR